MEIARGTCLCVVYNSVVIHRDHHENPCTYPNLFGLQVDDNSACSATASFNFAERGEDSIFSFGYSKSWHAWPQIDLQDVGSRLNIEVSY